HRMATIVIKINMTVFPVPIFLITFWELIIMAKIYNPVDQSMTVLHNGQAYSVDRNHPNHSELLKAFNDEDFDSFVELTKTSAGVKNFVEKDSSGNQTGLTVYGDKILYNGRELHSTLVDRIVGMK